MRSEFDGLPVHGAAREADLHAQASRLHDPDQARQAGIRSRIGRGLISAGQALVQLDEPTVRHTQTARGA